MQRDPLGYVDGMGLYEFVGGRVTVGVDPLGYAYKITTYEKHDVSSWAKAKGKTYTVVAREQSRGWIFKEYCCVKVDIHYTFEWRSYTLKMRVEWSYSGSGWQGTGQDVAVGGTAIATVGGIMTLFGSPTGPPVAASGGVITGVGLGIYIIGRAIEYVDSLVTELPLPELHNLGKHWEWRNLRWNWSYSSGQRILFLCDGDEILDMKSGDGSRRLLRGKSYPEKVANKGTAKGTGPSKAQ